MFDYNIENIFEKNPKVDLKDVKLFKDYILSFYVDNKKYTELVHFISIDNLIKIEVLSNVDFWVNKLDSKMLFLVLFENEIEFIKIY